MLLSNISSIEHVVQSLLQRLRQVQSSALCKDRHWGTSHALRKGLVQSSNGDIGIAHCLLAASLQTPISTPEELMSAKQGNIGVLRMQGPS